MATSDWDEQIGEHNYNVAVEFEKESDAAAACTVAITCNLNVSNFEGVFFITNPHCVQTNKFEVAIQMTFAFVFCIIFCNFINKPRLLHVATKVV